MYGRAMTTPQPPSQPGGPTPTTGTGPTTGAGPAAGARPAGTKPGGSTAPHRPGVVKRTTNGVKRILLVLVGALIALFAVLNRQEVQVDWILGEGRTPLILALVVSLLAGIVIGWLVAKLGRRGSGTTS